MSGLLSGSLSVVRYRVEGDLPDNPLEFIEEKVRELSFRDIDETFDQVSVGLVSVADILDTDFLKCPPVIGDYAAFGIRVDERKVPAATLKKFVAKEEERHKKKLQVPKLSRAQRTEIKENVELALLKKAVPEPKLYHLLWDLDGGVVYFLCTGAKPQDLLESVFREHFGVPLVREIPFTTALGLDAGVADVQPAVFA